MQPIFKGEFLSYPAPSPFEGVALMMLLTCAGRERGPSPARPQCSGSVWTEGLRVAATFCLHCESDPVLKNSQNLSVIVLRTVMASFMTVDPVFSSLTESTGAA